MPLSDKFASIAARNAGRMLGIPQSTESQPSGTNFVENLLIQMGLSPAVLKEQAEAVVKTLSEKLESIDKRLSEIQEQNRMIMNGQHTIVAVPNVELPNVEDAWKTIGCVKCGGISEWVSESWTHNHYRCSMCGFDDSVEKR